MSFTTNSDEMIIVSGCDDGFGMPLGVTLFSMLETLSPGEKVTIYVFSLGIKPVTKDIVSRIVSQASVDANLEFIEVDDKVLGDLPDSGRLSRATYLRIMMPHLLPKKYSKVLYLDADLLVRKNIRPLWEMDPGDNYVLASRDPVIRIVSSPIGIRSWAEQGFGHDDPYFNAGVLVVNLDKWVADDLSSRAVKYLVEHADELYTFDQDALNGVCHGKWGELDPTWNAPCTYIKDVEHWEDSDFKKIYLQRQHELRTDPAICHYISVKKPWTHGYRAVLRNEWFQAVKRSNWFTPGQYQKWLSNWTKRHYISMLQKKTDMLASKLKLKKN